MSGDSGDKPFAPTEHKLSEARKRGEVPKAQDLPVVAASLGVALALWALSTWLMNTGRRLLDDLLALALGQAPTTKQLSAAALETTIVVLQASLPLLLLAGLIGTLVKFLLVGAVFSAKPVSPDLKRMDPVAGLKRLFSGPTWVQLAKSLVATALVIGVLGSWILSRMREVLSLSDVPHVLVLGTRWWLLCILIGLLVLGMVALFDVFYQRYSFRRQMRMDMKDLRDESKQLEGHPEPKAERRAEHRRTASS